MKYKCLHVRKSVFAPPHQISWWRSTPLSRRNLSTVTRTDGQQRAQKCVAPMNIRNSRFRIVLRTSSLEITKRTCCLFVNVFILRRLPQRCRVLASSSTRWTFHYSNDQAVVKEKHFLQNNIGKGGKRKLHTQSNLQRVIWLQGLYRSPCLLSFQRLVLWQFTLRAPCSRSHC